MTKQEIQAAIGWINSIYPHHESECHRKTIFECLTAQLESGWRPIDSAPKRGRILLAAKTVFGEYQTCYGHWYQNCGQAEWGYDGYSFGNPKGQPDYWMPLPQPPNDGGVK